MRRLHALLITAGLTAAPLSAVAGPDTTKSDEPSIETFEWSTTTSRARLGAMVMGLTPELREHFGAPDDKGVLVARVEPKSSAAAAGLAVGDILTDVKGESVDSAVDVLSALADTKKDEPVSISVIRNHKPLTLTAKLTNDPGPAPRTNRPQWPSWVDEWLRSMPDPVAGTDARCAGKNRT